MSAIRTGASRAASVGMAVVWLLAAALPSSAQSPDLYLGGGWGAALLIGDSSDFLDGGDGPWISLEWRGERRASLGAAVSAEWVRLADDADEGTGARARNALLTASAGPTLGVWLGPVRPWLGGFVGVALGRWSTEWSGLEQGGSAAALSWGAGAGLQARVSRGDHPVSLGAEARLTDTGTLDFARAPALDQPPQPTGLIARDVAMVSLRAGISIGL
jgi:opacity protein-like surface antigen